MKKSLILFFLVLIITGSLVFAAGTAEQTPQKTDVTIRVLAGSIPWTDFIKTKLPEFTAKTGIKLNWKLTLKMY